MIVAKAYTGFDIFARHDVEIVNPSFHHLICQIITQLEILKVTPPKKEPFKVHVDTNSAYIHSYHSYIKGLVMPPGEYLIHGRTYINCNGYYNVTDNDSYTPLKVVEKLPNEQ